MRKRTIAFAVLAALIAAPALGVTNEPTGFGKAKLGSSVEAVKKLYPKMEAVPAAANLGSQAFVSDYLTRYVVRGVEVPELKRKADVELRFWKNQLWVYVVYYGAENQQSVIETLTKRFGPPNGTNPQKPGWTGDKSTAFVETSQHWYGVSDNAVSKDAQAWFIANLSQLTGSAPPAAAATPAAEPTAAATAPAATPAAQ
ncbi:hypothetical protein KF840_12060 [bacterium]|nr:hypothetical protein [bacterium]